MPTKADISDLKATILKGEDAQRVRAMQRDYDENWDKVMEATKIVLRNKRSIRCSGAAFRWLLVAATVIITLGTLAGALNRLGLLMPLVEHLVGGSQ